MMDYSYHRVSSSDPKIAADLHRTLGKYVPRCIGKELVISLEAESVAEYDQWYDEFYKKNSIHQSANCR